MTYLRRRSRLYRPVAVVVALALTVASARAADSDRPAGSLKWIPANAAFYTSMLRAGEQLDLIAKSKAWAKLKAMPSVQMLFQMAQAQMKKPSDPQAAMLLQMLQQPENQQLLGMLNDMITHEVFCYGAENATHFLELVTVVNGSQQMGNIMGAIQRAQGGDPSKAQVQAILRALNERTDLIQIPDMVIGFKLGKPDVATAQLKRLDDFLTKALQQAPPQIAQRYKKGAGATMFTLTLDGGLVPWDQVSLKQFEDKEGEFDNLLDKLKKLTLTISLGVRDDYLLLSMGESTAFLGKLGAGSLLAERPEFKPLEKYAGERLTGISYASKDLRAHGGMTKKDIDSMAGEARKYLEKSEMPPPIREKLVKDIGDLAKDFKTFIHEQGALLSFSFLSGHGQESFTYDWSAYPGRDGSKPLTLLDHVGGAPILAAVGRSKYQPENYQMLVKWIKHLHEYVDEFVVPQLNDDQKGQYEQVMKAFQPLLERLDKATGTMLLPALKDGQGAFVLDANQHSKKWQERIPESDKPLALLATAMVCGVSDAVLLKKAVGEYYSIINDTIAKLHDLNPNQIPEFQLPGPESKSVPGGTIYFYVVPEMAGLDKQIAPNAGLSDHVAVLSLAPDQTARLLKATPVKGNGPLADTKKPLAGAVIFDFAGLMSAVGPWIEYAIENQGGALQEAAAANPAVPSKDDILKQVRTAVEILKCFRGYTSATYFEDKALVTRGLAVFADLP